MSTSGNSNAPPATRQRNAMNAFRSSFCEALSLVILTMLGACAVGPNFVRPAPPDADRYTVERCLQATVAADNQAQRFTPGAALTADWWRLFKSAQLDAVVRQALANNPTLQAAEASLRQSQDNCAPVTACSFRKSG
jgi:hypothetical protein